MSPSENPELEREPGEVTRLLRRLSHGRLSSDSEDSEKLLMLIYDELRRLAGTMLVSEREDHTLQATALVHEAWMKLGEQDRVEWNDKAHFFAIAAKAMRRILVQHARSKNADKRGGAWDRVELDIEWADRSMGENLDLLSLDHHLTRFAEVSPRHARLVELRFFGGLAMPKVAEILDIPLRTAERDWHMARAWLVKALGEPG